MSVPSALRQLAAVVRKDVVLEWRGRELVSGMVLFAVLALLTFNFAFDLTGVNRAVAGAGALWVALIFASLLGLGRSASVERMHGAWEGVLLSPIDRGTLFIAKLVSSLLFLGLVDAVVLVLFAGLFGVPVLRLPVLGIVALGTIGLALLGTLLSPMAATTRAREVLLPVMLFPLAVPVVIAAVRATVLVLTEQPRDAWAWTQLLAGFDLLFLGVGYLIFGAAAED